MKRKKLLAGLMIVIASALSFSCGGGGGGETAETGGGGSGGGGGTGGGGSGGGGGTAVSTYLAYQSSIHLVDPDNPSSPITLSNKPINETEALFAVNSFNTSTKEYSNLHRHSIYWIEESDGDTNVTNGGPIKMAFMVKGSTPPTAKQISNITDACEFIKTEDDAVTGNTYIVVQTASADGECFTNDDGRKFIHSGMTNSDIPIDMSNLDLVTGVDHGNGITGFLILDTQNSILKKCDTNLSNCTNLKNGVSTANWFESNPNNFYDYICIDGDLYLFDGNSMNFLNVSCSGYTSSESDNSAIYAIDNNGNVSKLNHGGNSWVVIYNGGDANDIIGKTQNYVIINTPNGLKAVKKDGSTIITIDPNNRYGFITKNKVFFNKYATNSVSACIWDEGSSGSNCISNSYWVGFSLAVNGTLNISGGYFLPIYRILKVEDVSYTNNQPVGGTLYSVDPANTTSTVNLGTISPDFSLVGGFGIGNKILLAGTNSNYKNDIFYADLTTPNSLQNITNTPNEDEHLVF